MARVDREGKNNGLIGGVVFYTMDGKQYARAKPSKVKQTAKTKAAANSFGRGSTLDKLYRRQLTQKISLFCDKRYAAHHRKRMLKALPIPEREGGNSTSVSADLGWPESLVGFSFSRDMLWEEVTRIKPECTLTDARTLRCEIPEMKAGREIVFPKWADVGHLFLRLFSVQQHQNVVELQLLHSHDADLTKSSPEPPAVWECDLPEGPMWLVMAATVAFEGTGRRDPDAPWGTSGYVWAKAVGVG